MHTVQQKLLKNQCVDSNPPFFREGFFFELNKGRACFPVKSKRKKKEVLAPFIRYYNPNNKIIKRLIRPVRLT